MKTNTVPCLPAEILSMICGSLKGLKVFTFDPITKHTLSNIRLVDRRFERIASRYLFEYLVVESTELGDVVAFASHDGKGLLRNTRYLQVLQVRPCFELQMDSLYETLREFTLRPDASFHTATILEACLFTSELQSERKEALALGPLIAHACSHMPNLRHIESQCSKRFERHFATATRKFYIETGLVVDDIIAAPFNHRNFAHYPESYDHVLLASKVRKLRSSKCHNYNLALKPLVDMRKWNLHRDLRHLSTLEMVFHAPSLDGPTQLLDQESRTFIITLSRLQSLKSLSLTLGNSWEYVHTCFDEHHGTQKLYLDDLLLEGRKRRSDDETVYNCTRMESLEIIRFVNWPARPEQLKKFFFANRHNLKTIDMKRISLLAELEELPGDSWTKMATNLHKHMQVLTDLELQCLTTHYLPSSDLDFVSDESAEEVWITWLSRNHQELLGQIARHGISDVTLQQARNALTDDNVCRLELPLGRLGWVAPKASICC